ncbi:hypothetical protein MMC07_007133 [Pseudocyphellaria aurata]|nr:hypothetical protein [Pseudocyphellaria aurata]
MSPNDSAGRISKNVFLITPTTLFAFSVLFVIARTTLRLRYQKRLFIDDAFLFFAEICLCASVGLLYAFAEGLYLDEALITRPSAAVFPPDFMHLLFQFHKLSDAYLVLTYTSIFAVKFSFLFFFRVLVRRMHKMIVYWWTVFVADYVWELFWQIIENCLAVAMVCLSAFRSVFVGTQAQVKQPQNKQWYVLKKHPRNPRKRKNWMDIETEETEALPEIPRPTITGLKTFIRGKPHPEENTMHSPILDESKDQNTLHEDRNRTQIWVDYSISRETDETTNGNQQSRVS